MSLIVNFEDFHNTVRATEDGLYSVYDVIRFSGMTNPGRSWGGLTRRFPELKDRVENFKFPGRGQRDTPVATRENILYIIGLLPGAMGRSYREAAAKVFVAYLDASPELAESIIDRATPETLDRIERRLKGKKIRVYFTSVLQDHGVTEGWQFGKCTDAIYEPLFGGTAKQLKSDRGLAKSDSLRDSFESVELSATMLAEDIAAKRIKENNLQGYSRCHQESRRAGQKVRRVFED